MRVETVENLVTLVGEICAARWPHYEPAVMVERATPPVSVLVRFGHEPLLRVVIRLPNEDTTIVRALATLAALLEGPLRAKLGA
jgi:hypothetical protein